MIKRAPKVHITTVINRASPFYVDKQWLLPEAALGAAVIAQGIMDMASGRCADIAENLKPWCAIIGIAEDYPQKVFEAAKRGGFFAREN